MQASSFDGAGRPTKTRVLALYHPTPPVRAIFEYHNRYNSYRRRATYRQRLRQRHKIIISWYLPYNYLTSMAGHRYRVPDAKTAHIAFNNIIISYCFRPTVPVFPLRVALSPCYGPTEFDDTKARGVYRVLSKPRPDFER